jgi:hypothetical protein
VVSSVIVNNVGEDLATMEFENLSENVNNVGEDLKTMELRSYQRMLIMLNNIGQEFGNLSENVNINELDERCIPL